MDVNDILMKEYTTWATASQKQQTPATMLEFLNIRNALVRRHEMPIMVFGDKYVLSLSLVSDGDFSCGHPDMAQDDEDFYLTKSWPAGVNPKREALELLRNIRETIHAKDDETKSELLYIFDNAIEEIVETGHTIQSLGGNYEGTKIAYGEVFYEGEPIKYEDIRTGLMIGGEETDFCDLLAEYPFFDDQRVDYSVFLHGECAVFALVLHDVYGYPVDWVVDDNYDGTDSPWNHLVHVYCYVGENGTKPDTSEDAVLWMDIRGMTGDPEEFFTEFQDFFDYPGVWVNPPDLEQMRKQLINDMGEETFIQHCAAAQDFIDEHSDWFEIPG